MGLVFVYLLTGFGAVASLIRPIYGLSVYIILAVVRPEEVWKWTVPAGYYSRTVGIAFLIGWALHGFGGFRFGQAWIPAAALAAFWGWSLLASVTAQLQVEPWLYMDNLTKIVLPILAGITLIKTKKDLLIVAWSLGLAGAFLAYRENETYRAWGVGVGDNLTAHTMAAISGYVFFLALGAKSWWLRLPMLVLALAAAHAVMFHMSRGAMLGLAVSVVLTVIIIPKTPMFYGVLVCAALVGIRLAGPNVVEEFFTSFNSAENRDASATSRTEFWIVMAKAAVDNPLVGVGPRNWRLVSHNYGIPGREGHGAWQQLAAETGFPGISFILLFYGYLLYRLFPWAMGYRGPDYEELRPFAQMYVVSFCGWFVCQIFGSFYLVEFPYYVGLMGAGLLNVGSTVSRFAEGEDWGDEDWVDDEYD